MKVGGGEGGVAAAGAVKIKSAVIFTCPYPGAHPALNIMEPDGVEATVRALVAPYVLEFLLHPVVPDDTKEAAGDV
jgi:hypothetical protein